MNSPRCISSKVFRRKEERKGPSSGIPEAICRRFTVSEMERATRWFDPDKVIGDGGFGTIYKGCVDDDVEVAIKRWNPGARFQFRSEFWKEAELCCQLKHPNLVAFKGFCDDRGEMIRVYEYMPNNSLHHHLFGGANHTLPWRRRLQICIHVARGLHYLHCGLKRTILHRNLTARSILLGDDWVAKLTDLGLSIVPKEVDSRVMFTFGYADPEYLAFRQVSEKTDIYSLGVVLLQVLSGRRVIESRLEEPNLIEWVSQCRQRGELDEMVDPCVKKEIAEQCLCMFVDIAEKCVCRDRTERPVMGEVQAVLEKALEIQDTAHL